MCDECGRYFSRYSNMLRHKRLIHGESDDSKSDNESEQDSQESTERDSTIEEGDEEQDTIDIEDDDDIDSEDENDESEDEEKYSIWTYLTKVTDNDTDLQERHQDAKERLTNDELSEEQIDSEALRVVKPYACDVIFRNYSALLKIMHFAEKDPYHRDVLKTKRRLLMEEIDDPVEAIELAVKRRRYTIMKATDMLDEEDEDDIPPPPDLVEVEDEEDEEKST